MSMTVSEVERLTGVTVRTLHYYDSIGLLSPSEITEAGYRLYDDEALLRLQQIMFYRELDFPLKDICAVMTSDGDGREALIRQRELLELKAERLKRLMGLIDNRLKGEGTMSFSEFDKSEIEKRKAEYAAEVKARWGETDAYKESEKRAAARTDGDEKRMMSAADEIFAAFAAAKNGDPADAGELVKRWQDYITANHYNCTKEILAGLGMMYTGDERFRANIDRFGEGTAEFMSAAIAIYCAK